MINYSVLTEYLMIYYSVLIENYGLIRFMINMYKKTNIVLCTEKPSNCMHTVIQIEKYATEIVGDLR